MGPDALDHIAAIVGAKAAGYIGASIGLGLMVLGWLRRGGGRAVGRAIVALSEEDKARPIERKEWHDVRQELQRVVLRLEEVRRDLGRLEGAQARSQEKLGDALVDLARVEATVAGMSEHCDHCPGHGRR